MITKTNFYIITGGPGSGKTTLLNELASRGINSVPEVAREIIKEQLSRNGDALPWADTLKYTGLMLSRSIDSYLLYSNSDEIYFFDRGIPDTYAYAKLIKLHITGELSNAMQKYRYNKKVFILPPWIEIYQTDNERKQDFKEAIDTYNIIKQSYVELAYELFEVPCLPVDKRADFIMNCLP